MAELTGERTGRAEQVIGSILGRIWRFFCSVRAAAFEIFFLALLVLIGTLRGSIIPAQIPRYIPALGPLVERWYAFDVFHSLVFSLTLALVAIAITVCTINRVPGIWRSIARPTVRTTRHFFHSAKPAASLRIPEPSGAVAQDLTGILKARRYRVVTERQDAEIHIYADKHRFGKLGTFPFHLALILTLVGGIVGSEYGFREQLFALPEGSTRSVGHGTGLRVQLERFFDSYSEIGAPTVYRSDLVLYDGAREVRRENVTVNNPMTYQNVTFYQAAYGQAASILVTDTVGNVLYNDSVPFTYISGTNPDAPAGLLELPLQGVRLEMVFPNVSLDAKPDVGNVKLNPGQMHVRARDRQTNAAIGEGRIVSQGETVRFGELNVQFERERRFTVLQVAYNPGIPILFTAAFLLVFGLVATFAFPHRRVRALISETSAGTEVLIAPLARRDWGAQRDFMQTLAMIEGRFGAAAPYGRWSDVDE